MDRLSTERVLQKMLLFDPQAVDAMGSIKVQMCSKIFHAEI